MRDVDLTLRTSQVVCRFGQVECEESHRAVGQYTDWVVYSPVASPIIEVLYVTKV